MKFLRCIKHRNFASFVSFSSAVFLVYMIHSLHEQVGLAISDLNQKSDPKETGGQLKVSKSMKTILFWTRWYEKNNGFQFGYGSGIFKSCPVSNCMTTDNRALFNESHAVLFHLHEADFHSHDLPAYRFPHQRFVMYYFEPVIFSNRKVFDFAPADFFNWTFSWRRISDIASNAYGDFRIKPNSLERKIVGKYDLEESLDDYYGVNINRKSIMAAWFSSHCPTDVRREAYVAELQKYIQVDVYGSCGNYTCLKEKNRHESAECDELVGQKYLFYLAFENSFCPDYVTEKLYRPLRSGTVPIVFGAAHYSRFAPPHSYINALEFPSPRHLADYLISLSKNRQLYAHYLEWRRYFEVIENPIDSWCKLCENINDETMPPKTYSNMTYWWFDYYPCDDFQWFPNS